MRFARRSSSVFAPRRRAVAALAVVIGLIVLTLVPGAGPSWAVAANGPLAFSDGGAGGRDLYTAQADGTSRRLLVSIQAGREAQPTWSPDGHEVAYATELAEGLWGIGRVDVATGEIAVVTNGPGDLEPDWRRDGRRLAFSSFWPSVATVERSTITIVNPDGSGRRPVVELVSDSYVITSPSWSPDGSKLVFVLRSNSSGGELYVTGVDGTGTRRLLGHAGWDDIDPAWSPDGRTIAFAAGQHKSGQTADAVQHGIWMYDTVTGSLGSVYTDPALDLRRPSWSPDARQLAMDGRAPGGRAYELYTAQATGGVLFGPVTNGAEPAWGPDTAPIATATLPPFSPTPPPTVEFPTTTPPPVPTIPVDPTLPPFPTIPPAEPSATGPAPTFPWPTPTPTATDTLTATATPSPIAMTSATPSATMTLPPPLVQPIYLPACDSPGLPEL